MPKLHHPRSLSTILALALCGSAVAACNEKPPEPKPEPKPTAAAPTGNDGPQGSPGAATKPASPHGATKDPHGGMGMPGAAGGQEIGWTKPEAWEKVDHPSSMRKATFKIPKIEGDPEDAEMSVTQVGGGIQANIDRWEGQFEGSPEAKTEKKEVNGLEVTVVSIEGTFKSGGGPMMGGSGEPKEDWALLAAIVATEPAHFFKMTGPKKTVNAARGDFDSFVASFGKK